MWDFNQKTVKIGHKHNPSPQTQYMHYGAYILFSGRGAGVVVWLRLTIHASSQNSDALPTATLLGCCGFVVCVLSRCLRLAFFAFCCANSLVGCVLSPSWGSLLCCSPPRLVCMVGLGGWVPAGCLLVCVVCGRGVCLFVVSGGVFFVCFFLGCCLVGSVGECRGFLLVFLGDVLTGFS